MEPFATIDDYVLIYGSVTDEERLEAIIMHATAFLADEMERGKVEVDPGNERQASALARICCRLAHDMVDSPSAMAGVSQQSMTAGPFTGSWTFSNPTGSFNLLRSERKTLGIGRMRVGSVEPRVVDDGS